MCVQTEMNQCAKLCSITWNDGLRGNKKRKEKEKNAEHEHWNHVYNQTNFVNFLIDTEKKALNLYETMYKRWMNGN